MLEWLQVLRTSVIQRLAEMDAQNDRERRRLESAIGAAPGSSAHAVAAR